MILYRITFLLFALLLSSTSLYSQTRIGKKDQQKIQKTCETYQRQERLLITDFEASADSIKNITSEFVFDQMIMIREFYERMQYDLIFDDEETIDLDLGDSLGCIVKSFDRIFKLNVRKEEGNWVIYGFDNHEVNQEDLNEIKISIEESYKEEDVKDSIKELLKDFVDGWSEMRQFEKSDLMKSLSTKDFHDYVFANVQYEHLKGYGNKAVQIKEIGRVDIHADTAWCRVGIERMGGARFILLLEDNQWKVAGTNDEVATVDQVKMIEERISLLKELAQFDPYIDELNIQLEAFFKTGDPQPLKEIATDNMIQHLKIHRRLFGTFDTSFVRVRGIYGSSFPSSDYTIYGDSAYFDHIGDSLRWIKVDNKWMFDAFFVSEEIENPFDKAQQTFKKLNKLINLSYTPGNAQREQQGPPPPTAVYAIVEDVDYSEVKNYHRLSRYHKKVEYERGNDHLQQDLLRLSKETSTKTSFKGVIYVEFKVDNLGKAHDIQALDHIGSKEALLAEEVVSKLGNWLPNDQKQASLTSMVVAIQF